MNKNDKIYVAGNGLIGTALVGRLKEKGFTSIITRSSRELDLTKEDAVNRFFQQEKPDYVFLAAAKVGGIAANSTSPVDFIYPNLRIECNVINAAREHGVKKLLFIGCACVYPRECPQPIKEEYLMSGKPEPTNVPHSLAKLAGIVLCQSYNKQYGTHFITGILSNVFGPHDNFDPDAGHVVSGMITRFHKAKLNNEPSVSIWGTGSPRRDFIYASDAADACLFLMDNYDSSEPVNIGIGNDTSIGQLAEMVKEVTGYQGKLIYDTSKPDGMPLKLLDASRFLALGWKPSMSIKDGLAKTYDWFLKR